MKECHVCKEMKPEDQFYTDRTRPDGLDRLCRDCRGHRNVVNSPVYYRKRREAERKREEED